MYNIQTIKTIHLEPSNYCNSVCPQCPRYNNTGGLKKEINLSHLTPDHIKNIPIDRMKSLTKVDLCGALGDPLMNPDIDFIFDYFKNQQIQISTNASLRDEKWWKNLASYKNVTVQFCIDGIDSETHCRYRRKTSFEKIMQNAKSFITNGGRAEWQFIVFKHNQDQIDQAREMSQQLGFKKILFIHSDRFDYNNKWPVYVNDEIDYYLERSTIEHKSTRELSGSKQNEFYLKAILKEKLPEIKCQWAQNNKIYVSANGLVYPCCYIGYIEGEPKWENDVFKKCINDSYDLIDIKKHNLEEIINGPVYNDYFVRSLKEKPHMVCITQCHPKFGKAFLESSVD